jgi:hypothetical protein
MGAVGYGGVLVIDEFFASYSTSTKICCVLNMSQTARTNPGYLKQKLATHFFFSSEFVFFNQIAKETHFFFFFFLDR